MIDAQNNPYEFRMVEGVDEQNRVVYTMSGSLDAYVAGSVDERMQELLAEQVRLGEQAKEGTVVVDLGSVNFLDSSGLRSLLAAQRSMYEAGNNFKLRNVSEYVGRLLEITGLAEHFDYDEPEPPVQEVSE